MPEHKDITDPNLHEPKGVASATSGQVYVASGSGTGTWAKPTAANTTVADANSFFTGGTVEEVLEELYETDFYFYGTIENVSVPSFVLIPIPEDLVVKSIRFVLADAITVDNDTITISRGGDSAILGTQVISYVSSAEGSTFDFTPASNQTISATTHKYIKVATDGGSATSAPLFFTLVASRN